MNTYEITFTRENGSTGKDRITAANEKQARKDFREVYNSEKHGTEFRPSNKCLTHASSYRDVIQDLLRGYWS